MSDIIKHHTARATRMGLGFNFETSLSAKRRFILSHRIVRSFLELEIGVQHMTRAEVSAEVAQIKKSCAGQSFKSTRRAT